MVIGYVVSKYPAISHTFIQREVIALRDAGVAVETFSIRRTPAEELLSETDREEAKRTWSVLPVSLLSVVFTHFVELFLSPLRYWKTLQFALTHRPFCVSNLRKSVCYFAEAILLAVQCRRQQISRLHSHFVNSGGEVALIASQHLNVPWSCTLHGLSDYGNAETNQLRKKLAAADAVLCVSDYGKSQAMLASSPDEWNRLHVVRCGLNSAMLNEPAQPVSSTGPLKLITVGRLAPEKAHAGLLTAVAEARRNGVDVQLRLIGDGPLRVQLQRQVVALGLTEDVEFMGAQPPSVVCEELGRADVCVMSSLMEGLPVAIMESLAQCRPVIAPNVAGIPELVRPGENGWLFAPSRWDELTACIIEAASSRRSELSVFGNAGRRRVQALHSIETSAQAIADIFGVSVPAPVAKSRLLPTALRRNPVSIEA